MNKLKACAITTVRVRFANREHFIFIQPLQSISELGRGRLPHLVSAAPNFISGGVKLVEMDNERTVGFLNRRRSGRASVLLPASVVTVSAYQYLELVNLSATGAKLRGDMRPGIGKPALFRLDDFKVLCRVVWQTDDLCGVRFDEPMPPWALSHFRKIGGTAQIGMLTPEEKQAEEEWTDGSTP